MKIKRPGKLIMERFGMFVSKISHHKKDLILKVHFGHNPIQKTMLYREKIALEVLKGLAVPKRSTLTHRDVTKLLKQTDFSHIAMEWVPWKGCFGRKFPVSQAVGLWAFTIEQLCAFHRRDILYTDLKHNHVRVAEDFSAAMIIDFDGCVMVEEDGLYPTEELTYTGQLFPPEFHFLENQTERFVVYQVGMLLGSFLFQYFHNSHTTSENLSQIKDQLKNENLEEIYMIFKNCIEKNIEDRPKDLETLLALLKGTTLTPQAYDTWNTLREPYVKALEALGFEKIVQIQAPRLKSA